MGTCVFKTKDIKKLIDHTLNAEDHKEDWMKNKEPGIYFVHDHGVYCMSNGIPALQIKGANVVCYAKDCDPQKDEDFYENSRMLVGGDDFVETIEVNKHWLENCDRYKELHVKIDSSTMTVDFV